MLPFPGARFVQSATIVQALAVRQFPVVLATHVPQQACQVKHNVPLVICATTHILLKLLVPLASLQ